MIEMREMIETVETIEITERIEVISLREEERAKIGQRTGQGTGETIEERIEGMMMPLMTGQETQLSPLRRRKKSLSPRNLLLQGLLLSSSLTLRRGERLWPRLRQRTRIR